MRRKNLPCGLPHTRRPRHLTLSQSIHRNCLRMTDDDKHEVGEEEDMKAEGKNKQSTRVDDKETNIQILRSNQIPTMLPRSRHTVFVPKSSHPVAAKQSPFSKSVTIKSSVNYSRNTSPSSSPSASFVNNSARENSSRLDYSVLKNGSVISSVMTYANSVLESVEKTIAAQQDSIASKLGEIVDSLTVLPSLTQKIINLESKVDALEALLVERTATLQASTNECVLLRETISKQNDLINRKFVIFENHLLLHSNISPPPPPRLCTALLNKY